MLVVRLKLLSRVWKLPSEEICGASGLVYMGSLGEGVTGLGWVGGKGSLIFTEKNEGGTTKLAQKKALKTHWWRGKSRDGGPSMDSMWMESSGGRYGSLKCVFEGLQSACESSSEMKESGRIFLAGKESPKMVDPHKSWQAKI